ncbi:MAG TPA: beta-ketoacyl synthase chain length factor [Polaromonas sp.]|uniref:beta-ketoacyl synthase chain length factor n=1 Tax=Polaromonas sp. TaxID=1869339 RepID=UPI002D65068B|nr:beta-ketoacyl synthase chain length factor [Polaromonas sp.]HYW56508.1 beta-ketoacyl synthase chain length factor [Polaromonas sp.]
MTQPSTSTRPHSSAIKALTVFVEGVGLLGPGLPDWAQSVPVLSGLAAYQTQRTVLPLPMALPPAERRRAGAVVKVSLAVGQEAVTHSGHQAAALASVFSSSSGDGINCHEICNTLASSDRLISPTRFHNSVHNAPSGYWSISSGAMASSSVLCAHDASFSAGLLEAMTLAVVEDTPVLLVTYDTDYPEPLRSVRPIPDTIGLALVISPQRSPRSCAQITLGGESGATTAAESAMDNAALESLRTAVPAARGLPLLQAIAKKQTTSVVLAYLDGMQLALEVSP